MVRIIQCCCAARCRFNFYSSRLFTLPALLYFPQDAQIGRLYTNPPNSCRDAQFGRPIPIPTHLSLPSFSSQREGRIGKILRMVRIIQCCCAARCRFNFYSAACSRCLFFISLKTPKLGVSTPIHLTHVGTPNLGVLYQSPTHLPLPSFPYQREGRMRRSLPSPIQYPIQYPIQ